MCVFVLFSVNQCACRSQQLIRYPVLTLYLISLREGPSLNLELGWMSASPLRFVYLLIDCKFVIVVVILTIPPETHVLNI